jgi:hypothetical protein
LGAFDIHICHQRDWNAADMTEDGDGALDRLRLLVQSQAFGWHVGADRMIQAALDALLAEVEAPSLPLLAGLGRGEEHEARDLFNSLTEELGIHFEAPADRTAFRWAHAYWLAEQIVDGSLDPGWGADLIWMEAASPLDYPEELQQVVEHAIHLDDWDESRPVSKEQLREGALQAARELVEHRRQTP